MSTVYVHMNGAQVLIGENIGIISCVCGTMIVSPINVDWCVSLNGGEMMTWTVQNHLLFQ